MKIKKNVYALDSTKGSYSYLIIGEEPVLIDTGMPGKSEQIMDEIILLGIKLRDIAHRR